MLHVVKNYVLTFLLIIFRMFTDVTVSYLIDFGAFFVGHTHISETWKTELSLIETLYQVHLFTSNVYSPYMLNIVCDLNTFRKLLGNYSDSKVICY